MPRPVKDQEIAGEPSPAAAALLSGVGTLLILLGIVSSVVGNHRETTGHPWSRILGMLGCIVCWGAATVLFKASYRGEHPDWRNDGASPDKGVGDIESLL
jgi:hypothetical protein